MKKLKIPLALMITLGLLFVFACLPGIVSSVVDERSGKTPSYNDILPISLDISSGQETLSFAEVLSILRDSKTVNLNQSQATMSEDQVYEAVSGFMAKCENAGIFEQFEPTSVAMQPKLMYALSDSAKHLVVWTVTVINKSEPNQTLLVDVDDRTGKILCISYNIYRSYTMDDVWDRNKVVMDRFADLYFTQFGITEYTDAAEFGASDSNGVTYEYNEVDGGVSEAFYSFPDPEYGSIQVLFIVDGAGGFTVSFL